MRTIYVILSVIVLLVLAYLFFGESKEPNTKNRTQNESVIIQKPEESEPDKAEEPETDNLVVFHDQELERMIRIIINKEHGDILESNLEDIREIYIYGQTTHEIIKYKDIEWGETEFEEESYYMDDQGNRFTEYGIISSIEDLKYFPRLEKLTLVQQEIYSLVPLQHLKNLKYLNLSYNQIEDITPIKDLVHLEMLQLDGNHIQSIDELAVLKELQFLDISENNITDINSLRTLEELKILILQYNPITDISVIAQLDSLKELYMYEVYLEDWSVLDEQEFLMVYR